jgi:hypothetical protein
MYAIESPQRQTPQENLSRSITTTPWGSSPTSVTLTVYDVSIPGTDTDVTNAVVSGSNSVTGDVITTKRIGSLTLGQDYRVDVSFTDSSSNVWEVNLKILCRAA